MPPAFGIMNPHPLLSELSTPTHPPAGSDLGGENLWGGFREAAKRTGQILSDASNGSLRLNVSSSDQPWRVGLQE